MTINEQLAQAFNMKEKYAENTVALLDDGATVPFIARYRKDETGALDDQAVRAFADKLAALRKLEERRADVARLIGEQGKLTDDLAAKIAAAESLTALDDLYRPYRPKRRTRAGIAAERGLTPLAETWQAGAAAAELTAMAEAAARACDDLADADAAIQGACDILAEALADDAEIRARLREELADQGIIHTKAGKKPDPTYDNYLDYSEPLAKMAAHRVLAVGRAERDKALSVSLEFDEERAVYLLYKHLYKRGMVWQERLQDTCRDSWRRLLKPSLEKEVRKARTEWAEDQSTVIFRKNLRDLLLQPPVRGHVVLGFDPGFANGCKLAVIDATLRSAVSIARRVQDPLAELVKIDPRSIGVGQYQHDIDQKKLTHALDGVVEDCVNHVGVDLNTASVSLLGHIAGVTPTLAKNIVAYRDEAGNFRTRKALLKVPKLGPKTFEQCAGFLRIADGDEPLDNTQVHPESYAAVRAMEERFDCPPSPALAEKARAAMPMRQLAESLNLGPATLADILDALAKPGRDPRDDLPQPLLSHDLLTLEDLAPGMELEGTVTNIAAFGAFVDIGLHENGLVHISKLSDRFVKDPLTVVRVGQIVRVKVLDVDKSLRRISLSMRGVKQP